MYDRTAYTKVTSAKIENRMRKPFAPIMPITAWRTGRLARTKWPMTNVAMAMSKGWKESVMVQDYFRIGPSVQFHVKELT